MIFYTSSGPNTTVCLVLYKWAVHTTVCVPPPYKYNCMHSSFVQYQTYSCVWSSWGVKNHATSSLFSLFFQHKINNFFFKNIFNKKCQKCRDCIPIYSMKMLKFFHIKSHYCTLHFMYDISTNIRGEAHIQLYVQLICTVPNIQFVLVLLRCKKSRNLFPIFIIFST